MESKHSRMKSLVKRHTQANTSKPGVTWKPLQRHSLTSRDKTQVFQMLLIKWKAWTIAFLQESQDIFVLVNYSGTGLLWHKSDIFSLYHSSVLIHLIHSYPSLYNQTIIHWWRETGCLFQTILWANMYASAVCRIGCVVQKTISMALLQIPIEAVTKDSASHSQDKMSHKRGGKWAHLCLLEGKVPASLPFLGTLVVTVEILMGFPLSPPAAAALLFLLRLSFFPSQTTRGREGVFR